MAKTFGKRWKIITDLPEGGQAHTFIVKDLEENPGLFVLKRLKNSKRLGRFRTEIEALKNISSPWIPPVIDYSIEEGADLSYVVTPYLGIDLEKYADTSPLSIIESLNLFENLVNAVKCAHRSGIKHRDIKPNNVVVSEDGSRIFLIDFGICQFLDGNLILTPTDEQLGNTAFAAPECLPGRNEEPNFPCDIYSLGKLLYWMVTEGSYISREELAPAIINRIKDENEIVRFYIQRVLRGTIREIPKERWNAEELLSEVEITKGLIKRFKDYNKNGKIVIYDGFGLSDDYNKESHRSATTPQKGNPPADMDVGTAFVISGENDLKLHSITLALRLFAGQSELDLCLLTDLDDKPDHKILEKFTLGEEVSPSGGVYTVISKLNPKLIAGKQYWLVISVRRPDSQIALHSAPQDFRPIGAKFAERMNLGVWEVSSSSSGPGYAIRILGTIV